MPLWRTTAFGRSYVDLEICFALFVVAAWIALWVDRPEREHRSIAEILAGIGAVAAAAAALVIPAAAGHAAQTAPRGLAVALDWLHVDVRSALGRGPDGPAPCLGKPAGGPAHLGALGRGPALLERRARLGRGAPRLGDLGDRAAHAAPVGSLDDLLRPGDPRQGGASRHGDAARRRQPRPNEAPARRGGRPAGARPVCFLAPSRARLGRGADRRHRDTRRCAAHEPRASVQVPRPRKDRRPRRSAPGRSLPSCTRTGIR